VYAHAEVALHRSETDCWVIIHGKVYNVTKFLDSHPGGADILLDAAGYDATDEFEDTGHSPEARKDLAKYLIGSVDPSSAPVEKVKSAASFEKGGAAVTGAADTGVNPGVVVAVIVAVLGALFILLNP